jgi:hypothetical protein
MIYLMKDYVYVISCPLGLVKLGVASNPKQRVQNLQIGSPLPLQLAGHYAISDRATAETVVAALQQRFRGRRERGHWFRATPLELRQAIGDPEIVALYRSGEATQRAAARVAAEQVKAEAAQALAAASVQQRRRQRQQRRRTAVRMLAAGSTQAATADALGITDRTIRNWTKEKAFQRALARARSSGERQRAGAQQRAAPRPATHAQQNAARRRELGSEQDPEAKPDPHIHPAAPVQQSEQTQSRDEQDARRPHSRADLETATDRAAAKAVTAGGGIAAIIEATGLRTRANVLTLIDPAILEQAQQNDTAHTATGEPAPPG